MLASRVILNVRKAASQGEYTEMSHRPTIGAIRFRERFEESMDFASGVELRDLE